MLRVSLLIPLFLTTAALSPHRAVRVFTWWVAEMTDSLDDREKDIDRSHFHVEAINSVMDSVFHCTEVAMDETIPEPAIVRMIVNEILQMVTDTRVDIPDSIMALRDVDNSLREGICSALLKKLISAENTMNTRILARTSTLSSISWYENQINWLQKSIWSPELSIIHPLANRSLFLPELVENLERLRVVTEREAAIRGVIERHRGSFEGIIKETDTRYVLDPRATNERLESVVNVFVQDNNIVEFVSAVRDVYRSSRVDLRSFEMYIFRVANGQKKIKSKAATQVFNLENIILRGFVYHKKRME